MSGIIIPNISLSNTQAENVLLTEAQNKKLFMPIGNMFQATEANLAFQKAMEMGWIRLWDIQPILPNPMQPPGPQNVPLPARVFKITNSGQERLREIQRRGEIDKRLNNQ